MDALEEDLWLGRHGPPGAGPTMARRVLRDALSNVSAISR